MTVKAGDIVTVAGQTVLQRLQTQGLTNAKVPVNTIREIGNGLVVDKVLGEPDFTFTLESLAVDCSIEAILHGEVSTGTTPGTGAGQSDAPGTEYKWETSQAVNICSPWKKQGDTGGAVDSGHLIPGYFPQKIGYKFGVTENASQTVELRGGEFYYGNGLAPVEDVFTGDDATKAFVTANHAIRYRRGGVLGTTYKEVLGVLVNGVWQNEGQDFTVTGGGPVSTEIAATVTFVTAPGTGASVRIAYFTSAAQAYPDTVKESSLVLPGAVRGRNICVSVASGGADTWHRLYGIQTAALDASFELAPERELCNDEIVGFTVNGTDCTGTITMHAKNKDAFFSFLKQITGIDTTQEVVGYMNQNPLKLKIEITDPRNPGTVLKTLYVPDAVFDIPATPARVNAVVDFSLTFESLIGTFSAFRGAASI